jgi:antitoxin MazE
VTKNKLAKCRYIVYTYIMTTKVQKWGNSYAIRIPKQMVKELNLSLGSSVEFKQIKGGATIKPIIKKDEDDMTLEEMMEGVTRDQFHEVIDWGGPFGKEVW